MQARDVNASSRLRDGRGEAISSSSRSIDVSATSERALVELGPELTSISSCQQQAWKLGSLQDCAAGELGFAEALDAVGRALARHAAGGLEVAQVRQRFADREAQLMRVELAAEEHGNQRGRGARLAERVERFGEAL